MIYILRPFNKSFVLSYILGLYSLSSNCVLGCGREKSLYATAHCFKVLLFPHGPVACAFLNRARRWTVVEGSFYLANY